MKNHFCYVPESDKEQKFKRRTKRGKIIIKKTKPTDSCRFRIRVLVKIHTNIEIFQSPLFVTYHMPTSLNRPSDWAMRRTFIPGNSSPESSLVKVESFILRFAGGRSTGGPSEGGRCLTHLEARVGHSGLSSFTVRRFVVD